MKRDRKKLIVFVLLVLPLALVGALAWVVYTGLATGWNIVDALSDELLKED